MSEHSVRVSNGSPTPTPVVTAKPPLTAHFRSLKAAHHKLATLTAYDYTTARLLDEGNLDFILVGDSLGMVQLGYPDTVEVTMEDMIHHTRAVRRGVKNTPIVADLPALSYTTPTLAVENARRLTAAGADAVKLEGGTEMLLAIQAIIEAGIPVCGHLGMLPQQVRTEGGYHIKGKISSEVTHLLDSARALDTAGVIAIVLELVEPLLASQISKITSCPTIGIGSGTDTDGQILVVNDLVGFFPWMRPRFVTPLAHLADDFRLAIAQYCNSIR